MARLTPFEAWRLEDNEIEIIKNGRGLMVRRHPESLEFFFSVKDKIYSKRIRNMDILIGSLMNEVKRLNNELMFFSDSDDKM